jgi:uncharacterized membrane protein YdjX (TVP38/TMEM64 family)
MRDLLNTLKILALVLLVPVVPFLFFGDVFEAWAAEWQSSPPAPSITAAVVIGLLATDILLPIPSSMVNTVAGSQLGVAGGTAAACLGMTLGAILGFLLARRWGRVVALWFAKAEDLDRLQRLASTYGPMVLVILRAVPVLAEASVLMVGIHKLSWRRFLPPVILSNLGIAFAYAKFGQFAEQNGWLPLALGVSIALPLLLAAVARRWIGAIEERRAWNARK